MDLELQRMSITNVSMGGELSINGTFQCYTLERPPSDPIFRAIPPGTYSVERYFSSHFNRIMPHIVNVPGRTGIEIHYGNYPSDTEGCVLVGETRAMDFVGESDVAWGKLDGILAATREEVIIKIIDPAVV
jgi:hypothetical protein